MLHVPDPPVRGAQKQVDEVNHVQQVTDVAETLGLCLHKATLSILLAWRIGPCWLSSRELILGEDALQYIAYVMRIYTPLIPATRWSCSRPPSDSNDC